MELTNELPNEIHFNVIKFLVHPVAALFKNEFEVCGLADAIDDDLNIRLWAIDILRSIKEVKEFSGKFESFNLLDDNFLDYLF